VEHGLEQLPFSEKQVITPTGRITNYVSFLNEDARQDLEANPESDVALSFSGLFIGTFNRGNIFSHVKPLLCLLNTFLCRFDICWSRLLQAALWSFYHPQLNIH